MEEGPMKALYFKEHGDLDVLRYGDVPDPTPGSDEVIVRVKACATNHLDIWVRRGWPGLKLEMPHWCGADVAGDIVEVGNAVTEWKTGQRVISDPGVNTRIDSFVRRGEASMSPGYRILGEYLNGGAAEFICGPAGNLAAIPDEVDYVEAAAPLLVSLTAWRMLIHRGKLKPAETVLVVGAGGGVNSMAIQIAKLAGAFVYVVAGSKEKAEKAMALGADVAIDRTETDWSKEVYRLSGKKGVDLVVDNVGKATLQESMAVVARGGRIVIVGNTSGPLTEIDVRYIFGKQISLIGSTMGTHQDFLEMISMLWTEKLKPVIDSIIPLKNGRQAYRKMEAGELFGKIVLTP